MLQRRCQLMFRSQHHQGCVMYNVHWCLLIFATCCRVWVAHYRASDMFASAATMGDVGVMDDMELTVDSGAHVEYRTSKVRSSVSSDERKDKTSPVGERRFGDGGGKDRVADVVLEVVDKTTTATSKHSSYVRARLKEDESKGRASGAMRDGGSDDDGGGGGAAAAQQDHFNVDEAFSLEDPDKLRPKGNSHEEMCAQWLILTMASKGGFRVNKYAMKLVGDDCLKDLPVAPLRAILRHFSVQNTAGHMDDGQIGILSELIDRQLLTYTVADLSGPMHDNVDALELAQVLAFVPSTQEDDDVRGCGLIMQVHRDAIRMLKVAMRVYQLDAMVGAYRLLSALFPMQYEIAFAASWKAMGSGRVLLAQQLRLLGFAAQEHVAELIRRQLYSSKGHLLRRGVDGTEGYDDDDDDDDENDDGFNFEDMTDYSSALAEARMRQFSLWFDPSVTADARAKLRSIQQQQGDIRLDTNEINPTASIDSNAFAAEATLDELLVVTAHFRQRMLLDATFIRLKAYAYFVDRVLAGFRVAEDRPPNSMLIANEFRDACGIGLVLRDRLGDASMPTIAFGLVASAYQSCWKQFNVVNTLISMGSDANAANIFGFTPLFHLVWLRDEEGVRDVIHAGADVNAVCASDIGAYSPLHVAYRRGYHELAAILLEFGADAAVRDRYGRTPRDHACACVTFFPAEDRENLEGVTDGGGLICDGMEEGQEDSRGIHAPSLPSMANRDSGGWLEVPVFVESFGSWSKCPTSPLAARATLEFLLLQAARTHKTKRRSLWTVVADNSLTMETFVRDFVSLGVPVGLRHAMHYDPMWRKAMERGDLSRTHMEEKYLTLKVRASALLGDHTIMPSVIESVARFLDYMDHKRTLLERGGRMAPAVNGSSLDPENKNCKIPRVRDEDAEAYGDRPHYRVVDIAVYESTELKVDRDSGAGLARFTLDRRREPIRVSRLRRRTMEAGSLLSDFHGEPGVLGNITALEGCRREDLRFSLGPALGGSAPRFISHHLWNGLIYGERRWFVWPPGANNSFASRMSVRDWFKYAQESDAGIGDDVSEFIQEAGDVVYVPPGWTFAFINLQESVGFAGQFSFGMDVAVSYTKL